LGRAKDALLESYALMTPEALDSLTPEQRHCVYGMLGLRATITMDGTLEVSRTFGEGDLFCGTETRSYRVLNPHNTSSYGSAPCYPTEHKKCV
jgi:hypothetical protein